MVVDQRREAPTEARSPVGELWDSLILIGLAVSSLGAYVGLAFAAVKVFAGG